ncbi:MAG: sigma factor, partial [Evtepia sp.]
MQNQTSTVAAIANPLPEEVRKHIEATALRMVGHANLREDDFQDICQELSLQLIKAAPAFSPNCGSYYTFAQTVIKKHRDRIFRYRIRRGIDFPHVPVENLTHDTDE